MTIAAIRLTRPTVEVLRLLLTASADVPLWGAKISEQADLGKSSVSQILARLTALGWVATREEEGPHPGRPARAFRSLTRVGRRQAEAALVARCARNDRLPALAGAQRAANEQVSRPVRKAQPTAPDPGETPVRPRMAGHWPIRFPDPDKPRRPAATGTDEAATAGRARDGKAYEHLRFLREALRDINQTVTKDVFTQAAADPAHTKEYEPILTAIAVEADEIRKKTLHAPRAKNG